jgi:hypothetical protein
LSERKIEVLPGYSTVGQGFEGFDCLNWQSSLSRYRLNAEAIGTLKDGRPRYEKPGALLLGARMLGASSPLPDWITGNACSKPMLRRSETVERVDVTGFKPPIAPV